MLRTKKSYQLKRKPIKRKAKTKQQIEKNKEERDKMWKFFLEVWNSRPHVSQVSGKSLGNEINSCYMDHLLEKSKYPELKYVKWNICICSADEHQRKTNGFPLPKHQELINKAKERYDREYKRSPENNVGDI